MGPLQGCSTHALRLQGCSTGGHPGEIEHRCPAGAHGEHSWRRLIGEIRRRFVGTLPRLDRQEGDDTKLNQLWAGLL